MVAIKQGGLKSTDLRLTLYGSEYINHFVIGAPIGESNAIEFPFTYSVSNRGEKSAKGIEIFVRFDKSLFFDGLFESKVEGPDFKNIKFDHSKVAGRDRTITRIISFDELHTKQCTNVQELIIIRNATNFKNQVAIRTKDGIDATVHYSVMYWHPIDFVICQEDYEPIVNRKRLLFIDTSNNTIKEFFDEYNEVKHKNERVTDYSPVKMAKRLVSCQVNNMNDQLEFSNHEN